MRAKRQRDRLVAKQKPKDWQVCTLTFDTHTATYVGTAVDTYALTHMDTDVDTDKHEVLRCAGDQRYQHAALSATEQACGCRSTRQQQQHCCRNQLLTTVNSLSSLCNNEQQ